MFHFFLQNRIVNVSRPLFCILVLTLQADPVVADPSAWTYNYNAAGLLELTNGPRIDVSDTTSYTYDSKRNIQTVTNALNHVVNFASYNAAGHPLSVTDANGVTILYEYNLQDKLTKETVINSIEGNLVTQYAYYANGLLKDVIRTGKGALHFDYEGNDLVSVSNDIGERKEYSVDLAGNYTSEVIRNTSGQIAFRSDFTYDELGRLIHIAGNNGQSAVFNLDANGNEASVVNARLGETRKEYDTLGRVLKIIDAHEEETEFSYFQHAPNTSDRRHRVDKVTDARGRTTTYTIDGLLNLLSLESPSAGITTYEYDEANNRTGQTDSRGVVTNYSYDALNRLISISYPGSPSESVSFQYDSTTNGNRGIGRLTGITHAASQTNYVYSNLGLVRLKTTTIGSISGITRYFYSAGGQLTTLVYPSGREVVFTYDNQGRVSSIATRSQAGGTLQTLVFGVAYLPFGPARAYTYGNGLSHDYIYDLDYRLQSIQVGGINPLLSRNYFYDLTNNIIGLVDGVHGSKSQSFGYDLLDRLVTAEGGYGQLGYTYDAVGNRLSETRDGNTDAYTYDYESHRLESITATSGNRSFTYDNAGNRITQNGNTIYTYNHANRLISVSVNGMLTQYTYNPLGQRIKKQLTNGQQEHYFYNEAGQLLAVHDATGALVREYIYWGNQQIALVTSPGGGAGMSLYYIHSDHLNTAQVITDSAQQVKWMADFEPFGRIIAGPNNNIDHFSRFPGQYVDLESNLYYNYFRDYDPSVGRYIQSDPIGLSGGINTYAYVGNNPLQFVDLLGLSRLTIQSHGSAFTDLQNPTGQDLINALKGYPDGTIAGLRLTGHGNQFTQCVSKEKACRDYIDNNMDLYSDGKLIGNLQKLLQDKTVPGSSLEFPGCDNANGDKNFARALSRQLPDRFITGGFLKQFGRDDHPLFGTSDGALGLKRIYLNDTLLSRTIGSYVE